MQSRFWSLLLCSCLLALLSISSFAQAPGNVANRIKLWLRADSGVSSANNQVTQWKNYITNSNITTQASKPASSHVVFNENKFNYNPAVTYDGTIFEELRGVGSANDWTDTLTAYSVSNYTSTTPISGYFIASTFVSDKKGISMQDDFYMADGHGATGSTAANTTPGTFNGSQIIGVQYLSDNTYNSSIYRNGLLNEINTAGAINAPVTDTFEIGGRMAFGWHTRIFIGDISEVAVFRGVHTQLEREKIHSYLAIKHGLTLDHTAIAAYLNSAGNVVFSDPSGIYWQDIAGLGRDDNTGLLQKQSHQQDDSTRLYVGALAATNKANTGTFGGNNQYMVMGRDNGSLNAISSAEYPGGYNISTRIGREWKVINTGFTGTFSIDITSNIGISANAADFRLLVDTDSNFVNASVYTPVCSYANGIVTVSGITNAMIPANSMRFITIALAPVINTPIAGFIVPDTVCVNASVTITDTSSGASNYYWNFCVAPASTTTPTGSSIGSFTPSLNLSAFMDYAYDNGNYYGFVTNNFPGRLVRLDFGNSLLNTPVPVNLGNFGGVVPDYCEGIQIVKNEGQWYALIVGGYPVGRIINLNFGASLSNTTPVPTNWGNVGNMNYPTDLHVFKDSANWYGFTVNSQTNSVTRFSFTNSFSNTPTGVNLGNIGSLNFPTGIYAVNNNSNWHVFITNATTGGNSANTSLTRLDFGNSLLNTPTGVNLGNLGILRSARDLTIYKSCGEIIGYVINYSTANDIIKLDFNNNLTTTPTATSIGNIGNLDFPACLTKIFRVSSDLYSFVTNVTTNAISRLQFSGCNNSSIPNSTAATPPVITYNAPGIYNITLTIDEGLATQQSVCKQVVVIPKPLAPAVTVTQPTCSTPSGTITVTSPLGAGLSYSIDGVNYSNTTGVFTGLAPNSYNVTVQNSTGCTSPVTVGVVSTAPNSPAAPAVNITQPTCANSLGTITITSPLGSGLSYSIDGVSYSNTTGVFNNVSPNSYNVTVQNASGCISPVTVAVVNPQPVTPAAPSVNVTQPTCSTPSGTITVTAPLGAGLSYSIDGVNYSNTTGVFTGLAPNSYNVTVQSSGGCTSAITVAVVNIAPNSPAAPAVNITQPTCANPLGTITITSPLGAGLSYSIDGVTYTNTSGVFSNLSPNTYNVTVQGAGGCISLVTTAIISPPANVPAAPNVTLTQPTCTNPLGTITVTAPLGTGLSYSVDGVTYTNTTGVFTNLSSNTYNVTVQNSLGCTSAITLAVINAAPITPATPNVTLTQPTCTNPLGIITVISPTGAGLSYSIDGVTYTNTSGVFSNLNPNTYNVTVQGVGGCISPATIVVINAAPGVPATPNVTITQPTCTNPFGTITVTAPVGAGFSYSIDGADYTNTTGVFNNVSPATYTVTVRNTSNCTSAGTTAIINTALPLVLNLSASPNTFNPGQTISFVVTGNMPFTVLGWQPAALFTNQTAASQTIAITNGGPYLVWGTTTDGCRDTAAITLNGSGTHYLYIPNAFTPNGDGLNDNFKVYGNGIDKVTMKIFNQWGERIFVSNDAKKGWDGKIDGTPQSTTVFVYTVNVTFTDGEQVFRYGTFTLIR